MVPQRVERHKSGLYEMHFYRFILTVGFQYQFLRHVPLIIKPFRDETGKITTVKYRLIGGFGGKGRDDRKYIWRLDARSIRYMKRAKIIENIKEF